MFRVGSALLILSSAAFAQNPSPLDAAKARAAQLTENLPSYTCDVTGRAETTRDGKTHDHVKLEGAVDVRKTPVGFNVSWRWTLHGSLFNWHPEKSFFVHSDFLEVEGHLVGVVQPCYRFSMDSARRIDFTSTNSADKVCSKEQNVNGFFELNPDGMIHRAELKHPGAQITQASIDLVPVDLNGSVHMLTEHLILEHPADIGLQRFDVHYANCHVFTAKATLEPVAEGATPPPAPSASAIPSKE